MGELRTQLYRSSRITKQVFESKLFTQHKQTEKKSIFIIIKLKEKTINSWKWEKFKKVIPKSLSNKTC